MSELSVLWPLGRYHLVGLVWLGERAEFVPRTCEVEASVWWVGRDFRFEGMLRKRGRRGRLATVDLRRARPRQKKLRPAVVTT